MLTVYGPVTSPRVDHRQSGSHVELALTVPYGQFVVIDLLAQSVMLGGTASRMEAITSDSAWFMLPPGGNELQFSGIPGMNPDGTAGSPWMTAVMASAWA